SDDTPTSTKRASRPCPCERASVRCSSRAGPCPLCRRTPLLCKGGLALGSAVRSRWAQAHRPVGLVLEGVSSSPIYGTSVYDVSSDGSLVYVPGNPRGNDRRLVRVDRTGKAQRAAARPKEQQQRRRSAPHLTAGPSTCSTCQPCGRRK